MKLTRLKLSDFQRFTKPLEVGDLADGINLFVGPNESGKSTLARAIRAAFFERHKSTSVTDLRPWGDSGAAPEVELEFSWQDETWHLQKRFLSKSRCDLGIAGQQFSGDEAEDKLAELLGYEFAGRGASKAEHHGIPGLLWVEQGSSQAIQEPASHASDYLHTVLGNTLGEIASSSGDALLTEVKKQRDQLLTEKTGNPKGDYKTAREKHDAAEQKLNELQDQIATYRQQVDRLGDLRDKQQTIDVAEPWQEQRAQAAAAQSNLDEVQAQQNRQQKARDQQENTRQQQQLYRDRLQAFENEEKQLEERATDRSNARQQLDELRDRQNELDNRLQQASDHYEHASKTLAAVREQAHRDNKQKEHDELAKQVESRQKILQQAREVQDQINQQREYLQTIAIDTDALTEFKQCEADLRETRARQETVATRVQWQLEPGQSLTLGDQTVSEAGETRLLEDTEIHIPGTGKLKLQPGGSDVAELRRTLANQTSQRDELLRQLGVEDLEQAEKRAEDQRKARELLNNQTTRRDALAPDGLDDLGNRVQLDEQRLQQLAAEITELPPAQTNLPALADAEAAEKQAGDTHRIIEEEQSSFRSQLASATNQHETAETEWQKAKQALDDPERQKRQREAEQQLTDLNAQDKALTAEIEERETQIQAANPQALQQDVDRYTQSAESMEKEARERDRDINELRVRLEEQGAQGLEEKAAEQRQQVEYWQRRRDELAERAEALELLQTLLQDQRRQLTQQMQAPLQKHLQHYLSLLFPGASLQVDENLVPRELHRQGSNTLEQGELENFSYGAREQMGLISRLAYADLLREAGRPTLLMLDDALVHSDSERLEKMKRILFDAAQRHQLLLFTCHPENWRDLGVAAIDMQALDMQELGSA